MRVSLPITIAACLVVVLLSWWLSTRSRDFLTPPDAARLAEVRQRAISMNPTAEGIGDALSPADPRDGSAGPVPVILPRHIQSEPRIDDYLEEARHGAAYLSGMAHLLESSGHPDRALICWERVLDSSKASEAQSRRAADAILQLKSSLPASNEAPQKSIPLVIQAGTGPAAATKLAPSLEKTARLMEACSAGVISVTSKVSIGTDDMIEDGKSPVALWISGPDQDSPSTEVVSFFIPINATEDPDDQVQTEAYRLIRHSIGQMDNFQPLPKPSEQYSTDKLLESHITRLVWKCFGESLQK